ncbi:MAG: hypothetical protein HEQ19_29815 [Gloeotrichia echinulata CP02]|jgi:hypothetical protein
MDLRKASQDSKLIIEVAVSKIAGSKGWKLDSPRWLEQASKAIDPDWEKEPYPQGISKATWKRFRSARESISAHAFNAFCQILELNPEEIVVPTPNPYGLTRPAQERFVFNDYSGDRIIDELWADPLAIKHGGTTDSYIKASVISNEQTFIKISFVRQGWGTNVTIRPMNDAPVNALNFQHLKFKIRTPKNEEVGLRVRITDANQVCWAYGSDDLVYESKNLSTSSSIWSKDILISLDLSKWFHFRYDGCQINLGQRPNLSKIYLIAFEVGFEPKINEPKCGLTLFSATRKEEGEIHISPIIFE